jgi:nucleotide-binding universal stress UspA family protein
MYDDILVPTDGSDPAAASFEHALEIADRFDATVHALYVVEAEAIAHEAPELPLGRLRETLRDEGETALDGLASLASDRGVEVSRALVEGVAADAILDYAAETGVDLIVMGTHGRRGLDRFLVGSVTERVLRRADAPVLAVSDTER